MNADTPLAKFRLLFRLWRAWSKTSITFGQLVNLTGVYLMTERDDEETFKLLVRGLQLHAAGGPIADDHLAHELHSLGWRTKEEYLPVCRLLYLGDWVSIVSEDLWSKVRLIQNSNYDLDDYEWATNEDGEIEYDA